MTRTSTSTSHAADLFFPFPTPTPPNASSSTSGSISTNVSKRQKKQQQQQASRSASPALGVGGGGGTAGGSELRLKGCWDGVGKEEKDGLGQRMGVLGYFGYSVVGFTVTPLKPGTIPLNPFSLPPAAATAAGVGSGNAQAADSMVLPFPEYDPRVRASGGRGSDLGRGMRQLSRLHLVVDDSNTHGLTASHTPQLQTYDLISVQPLTPEAFSKACIEFTRPGPNQVGIITVTTSAARLPFKGMKRSLVKTALRNGAVFEFLYAGALGAEGDEKARQNFMANAREGIRVIMAVSGGGGRDGVKRRGKGGGGVIFSSGDGPGLRGPADLINLATLLGMPANQAKEAVIDTPLKVILRAQARRTYKGVMSVPRMVMPTGKAEDSPQSKRKIVEVNVNEADSDAKKVKVV